MPAIQLAAMDQYSTCADIPKMYDTDQQKLEIEKIQRAVNESLKARRTFRISKRAVRGFNLQPPSPKKPEAEPQPKKSLELAKLSIDHEPPAPALVRHAKDSYSFPVPDPWPTGNCSRSLTSPTEDILNDPRGLPREAVGSTAHKQQDVEYPFECLPCAPPIASAHDLALVMNYLDNIFPLQCYFYQPSSTARGRGWMLGLILRSKPVYFTTLAFSTLTQIIFEHHGDVSSGSQLSIELDTYHGLAVSELQRQLRFLPTVSGPEHLRAGVEILACTTQFLSIEVFREAKPFAGWKNDWEFHLEAAGTLLSVIGTGLALSSSSTNSPVVYERDLSQFSTESLSDIAALDFYMTVYVWCDILRCACKGVPPSAGSSFGYMAYLEEGRIRLDHVMGCRNWALISVRETSDLEARKLDMLESGTLEVQMLYRKAAAIENRLTSGLRTLPKRNDEPATLETDSNLVTEIFALSALVYLALVVSGNSHRTPTVRIGVAKCLAALKALPGHLLLRVAFPFVVAGCMADGEEKSEFRDVLLTAEVAGYPLGTLWNAMEVMEAFWFIRATTPDQSRVNGNTRVPWAIAMEHLEVKTLII